MFLDVQLIDSLEIGVLQSKPKIEGSNRRPKNISDQTPTNFGQNRAKSAVFTPTTLGPLIVPTKIINYPKINAKWDPRPNNGKVLSLASSRKSNPTRPGSCSETPAASISSCLQSPRAGGCANDVLGCVRCVEAAPDSATVAVLWAKEELNKTDQARRCSSYVIDGGQYGLGFILPRLGTQGVMMG